ncbi:MAG: hypothetical protein P8Y28_13445 [Gammaproteobacteria bacterium]|jgi:hypothetical protein
MKAVILVLALSMISACSTMQPPRYSISVDNIQTLKTFNGTKAQVTGLTQAASFEPNCRLMGPIEPADGLTVPQFITKAFNDEMKMADLHSKDGIKLNGDITKIEFSSISGLTGGYWDIEIKLNSSNGKSMTVNNKYEFESGFDAITACNATADALSPAVQDLIKAVITNPNFESLIKES